MTRTNREEYTILFRCGSAVSVESWVAAQGRCGLLAEAAKLLDGGLLDNLARPEALGCR